MRFVIIVMLLLSSFGCKKKTPPFGVKFISVEQAREMISTDKSLNIIDVRTEEETDEGKIEKAQVIDVRKESFDDEIQKLDKTATYLVYCRSGSRSTLAVEKMAELGFDRLYMMEGGYLEWLDTKE